MRHLGKNAFHDSFKGTFTVDKGKGANIGLEAKNT